MLVCISYDINDKPPAAVESESNRWKNINASVRFANKHGGGEAQPACRAFDFKMLHLGGAAQRKLVLYSFRETTSSPRQVSFVTAGHCSAQVTLVVMIA